MGSEKPMLTKIYCEEVLDDAPDLHIRKSEGFGQILLSPPLDQILLENFALKLRN